jgi:NAD(P)-dependent dehydrogenase (short-subunit alcohol dehydrogenase family)
MARLPWDMTGKVVVISGGNSGIGLGFARGIAKAGGSLVIWGRRADKNEQAAAELRALGAKVLAQTVDVADESAVISAMAASAEKMGRIDGVIANAGIMNAAKSFTEMTGELYRRLIEINQFGAFYTAREGARHMRARAEAGEPGGSIVFCASLSAITGSVAMQHYNSSKGAMAAMARGIAVEMGKYGIRCNTVCPGYTISDTVRDPGPGTPLGDQVRERNPLGRFGMADDFEGIGVYFMSDASRFHTGDLVLIDGGWMANAGKSNLATGRRG